MPHNQLDEVFKRLIKATGPISVNQYMAECNQHYYQSHPIGKQGDFITAPEISQIFGEMIGLWLVNIWMQMNSPHHIAYVELGPGRGSLAKDCARVFDQFGFCPEMHFVEGSQGLRTEQADMHSRAIWHDNLDSLPQNMPLLFVANEFFDALPIRQLIATENGWREVMVNWTASGFENIIGSKPMDAAVPENLRGAPRGSILETSPASSAWCSDIVYRLKKQGGVALIIDYGYDKNRIGSSLQAIKAHEKIDPLEHPGTADLSAHVNFEALANIAYSHNLLADGPKGQGEFLLNLGIAHRAQDLARKNPDEKENLRVALDRLVSPEQMGTLFRVMAIRAPGWPQGAGWE